MEENTKITLLEFFFFFLIATSNNYISFVYILTLFQPGFFGWKLLSKKIIIKQNTCGEWWLSEDQRDEGSLGLSINIFLNMEKA